MGTSSCARPARVVRETLVFDALDADGHPELPASGVLGHGRAVVSAPVIPIFCVGIVDFPRFGSVPLSSSRGTGTDAASIISWAGACLDPGFPSTGNATTLAALSAGILPLGPIEGDASPSMSGSALPDRAGDWGVGLRSLTSATC